MDYLKMEKIREQFIGKESCTVRDVQSADESLTFEEAETIVESVNFINSIEAIRKLAYKTPEFGDKSSDEYRSIVEAKREYAEAIYDKMLDARLNDEDLQKSVFICTRYGGALDRDTSNAIVKLYSEGDITTKEFANLYAQELGTRYGKVDIFDTRSISEINRQIDLLTARLRRQFPYTYDVENAIRRIKEQYKSLYTDERQPERNFKKMEKVRYSLLGQENCTIEDVLGIDDSLSEEEAELVLDSLEFVNENEELRRLAISTHSPNDEKLNEEIDEARGTYIEEVYGRMIDLIKEGYDLRTIMFLSSRDTVSDVISIDNVIALLHQGYVDIDDVTDLYVENLEEEFGKTEVTDTASQQMFQHYMSLLESRALRASDMELQGMGAYEIEGGRDDIHELIEKIKAQYRGKREDISIAPTLTPKDLETVLLYEEEFVREATGDNSRGENRDNTEHPDGENR